MRVRFFTFLVLFAFAFASSSLFAQGTCNPPCPSPSPSPNPSTVLSTQWEISPYAGYIWNGNNNGVGSFMNTQILGVRGGGYVTQAFEIGGNWSWNNHFQPKPENTTAAFAGDLGFPQAHVRSNLWEGEFTYNFGSRGLFGHAIKPYLVAGGGGITTNMKNGDVFVLNNTFIDVPGVSPATLRAAQLNGTLQSIVPGVNTTNGVAFVGNPTGTGSTVVIANDVFGIMSPSSRSATAVVSKCRGFGGHWASSATSAGAQSPISSMDTGPICSNFPRASISPGARSKHPISRQYLRCDLDLSCGSYACI